VAGLALGVFLGVAEGALAEPSASCPPGVRRALVLSGGGAKGAIQVGALWHLVVERGCDFEILAGVSVGALNAAILAQARGLEDGPAGSKGLRHYVRALRQVWAGIRSNDDIYHSPLLGVFGGLLGIALGRDGLYSFEPLKALIRKHLDEEALRRSDKHLLLGVVSLQTGRFHLVPKNQPNLADYVVASASIPLALPPQELPVPSSGGRGEPQQLVDGGVIHNTPVTQFVLPTHDFYRNVAPPEEVFVILTGPFREAEPTADTFTDGFAIAGRALWLITNQLNQSDVALAGRVGELLKWREKFRAVVERSDDPRLRALLNEFPLETSFMRLHLIIPAGDDYRAADLDTLDFDPLKIRRAMEIGCRLAARFAESGFNLPPLPESCRDLATGG
jgi:NTE family protein